jgi:hypothetical protein
VELGYSVLTRRERLERIAMAERDRRAGRVEVAVAALGEATEWPARAVLALAKLPEFEAAETRRILEEGLDAWAAEAGLEPFEELIESASPELDSPIDNDELDRAFAEAEAQTDEMHSANHVAARILMDEPIGLAEFGDDPLESADETNEPIAVDASVELGTAVDLDADLNSDFDVDVDAGIDSEMDAAIAEDPAPADAEPSGSLQPKAQEILATLERWLQNLEGMSKGRTR